ncbi:hypothetical protein A8B75_04245 [Sphingomonadales bacterium EhC05]|nr:hypothetical protein A8B75_04245 [Sphingomonadales bacterium EhC05]
MCTTTKLVTAVGPIALAISAFAATAMAEELRSCEVSDTTEIAGTVSASADIHVVHIGISAKPTMEGRYRLAIAPTHKAGSTAPDPIKLSVVQLAEGEPVNGKPGFRTLVIEAPGVVGSGHKGRQPTIAIKSGSVELGVRNVSPDGTVLFVTDSAGMDPITIEAFDLGKRLSRPREDIDITIILSDAEGMEIAQYLLPGTVMLSMKDSLSQGYGMIWPAAQQGKCKPQTVLSGYI